MPPTAGSRQAMLFGGVAAALVGVWLLAAGLVDREYMLGEAWIVGVAVLAFALWLVLASAPWSTGWPAWSHALHRFWQVPFVAGLGGFMLWVRLLPYPALVGQGRAYFIGTDPFYHYRETLGIVRAFPRVPRWDPWTFYPNGTGTGQFGSLFDWTAAAFVVLTKGRDASEAYVQTVLGTYPAVLGAILIVPFYFLAKRLLGTPGAVVASVTIALLPGEFLIRSVAGYSDHHVAEALFCIVSILGVHAAATKAHERRGELRGWRDVGSWWRPAAWGALGGVALAANFYAWPPALIFALILFIWLSAIILLEDAKEEGDARGYALGGAVAFLVAGLLMVPAVESYALGDFNTFGILHPLACFAAALVLWALAAGAAYARRYRHARAYAAAVGLAAGATLVALGYALAPGDVGSLIFFTLLAIGVVAGFVALFVAERGRRSGILVASIGVALAAVSVAIVSFATTTDFWASVRWGLSWVTGVGVQRTTFTIAEARPAELFCSDSSQYSCLTNDFGPVASFSVFIFLVLLGYVLWKRRREDILLAIWSLLVIQATRTQIRFSYYFAIVLALLVGWTAARLSEWTGLEAALAGTTTTVTAAPKGRKAKRVEASAREARWWQVGVVALVALLILPGNVFATQSSFPGWERANIRGADGDLVLWMEGLDWMRQHTPDAGVDLSLVVPPPPPGQLYEYPSNSYGVLTWWDYGHWIETVAQRPPVANPFQQAAPFAATWFTERDPQTAERMLDDWVKGEGLGAADHPLDPQGKGPVRYVFIDDAIATGKWGAITVWAHSQNASRDQWADGEYTQKRTYQTQSGGSVDLVGVGPEYEDSMMGRLYDHDGNGLSHYRLVWEDPGYDIIGTQGSDQGLRCLHDVIGGGCGSGADVQALQRLQPDQALDMPDGTKVYDTVVASRLKLFERVAGAHVVGTAAPNAQVTIETRVAAQPPNASQSRGTFDFSVTGTAGPDGRFDIVFPYSNADPVPPSQGGTDLSAHVVGTIVVVAGGQQGRVTIPDEAVLKGETVSVTF